MDTFGSKKLEYLRNIKVKKPRKTLFWMGFATCIGAVSAMFKDKMGGSLYLGDERLDGKVVIITGANSGIGKETAYEMADRGAKVYMACRNLTQCEEVRKDIVSIGLDITAYCRKLDLSSIESIKEFVNEFRKTEDTVDILVNNAAVYCPPIRKTKDGFEVQMGVNYFGHFLLTNLLLDSLKKSSNSRIINVTCRIFDSGDINKADLNFDQKHKQIDAYKSSKLANILFTKELAGRLTDTNVTALVVDPGICSSNLMRFMGQNGILFNLFVYPFMWPFIKSSKRGAQGILYAALDPEVQNNSGAYISNMKIHNKTNDKANDSDLARWLWIVSEKWTRLKS